MRFEKGLIVIEGADLPVNKQTNRRYCKVFTIPLGLGVASLVGAISLGEVVLIVGALLAISIALYLTASLYYLGWLRKDEKNEKFS